MRNVNKIIYLTGTRAEYGLMKSTLMELNKKFDLGLIVTGTHLSKKYGRTIEEIKKDHFKIVGRINLGYQRNDLKYMADNIGRLIPQITKILSHFKPDLVLVEGDRGEQLSMAIASATMNIPIAHTSGGVVSKSIDDSYRNAITKLAHIHLAPTKKSRERIIKMNEEDKRIKVVGTPMNLNFRKVDVYKKLNLKRDPPLIIVLQHPVSNEFKKSRIQMRETMEAIKELKYNTIVIYPNSDAGSNDMIDVIEEYRHFPFIRIFNNLDSEIFMNLLQNAASVLVGNSSAGIVEAPFFKLPFVNVGIRQDKREHGDNIINVDNKKDKIINAINLTLTNKFRHNIRKNPYKVRGNTETNIVRVISKLQITPGLLSKEPVF
jgi:UDP-hydrolysing UDP-N-acetyl-D-glucosamine 2-epimerase